jgi:class 3 adenylate cyclase
MTRDSGQAPVTRYVRNGDASIAYQVTGEGPLDLVMVPGFPSHLELAWQYPRLAHFYRRLASFSRLILLDKRGIGLSDRVPNAELPGVEQRMEDLLAVLDAVGSERAALVGASDGGPLAMLFAATHPERTWRLVVINSYACRMRTEGYPWAPTAEEWQGFQDAILESWGQPVFVEMLAPSMVDDRRFLDWWAGFLRQSVSPGAAVAILRMNALIDIRSVLPAIHTPTLVLHRVGDRINPVGGARFIAEQIPEAHLVEMEGSDHHPWIGDAETILSEIEGFATGTRQGPQAEQVLGTMLFTDIVDSTKTAARLGDRRWTALMETHDSVVRMELEAFRGREIKATGDGFVALFDGPARAIRCGLAIRDHLRDLGIDIRAGVHTSEVELVGDDIRGLGVHVAARIMGLAGAGDVIVSSVVRDLTVGSGLSFTDRGRHTLKGVPGEWQVFAVGRERNAE